MTANEKRIIMEETEKRLEELRKARDAYRDAMKKAASPDDKKLFTFFETMMKERISEVADFSLRLQKLL